MTRDIYIYGAGVAGRQLLNIFRGRADFQNPLGWIDDDPNKVGTVIDGLQVYSFVDFNVKVKSLSTKNLGLEVFVAIPSSKRIRRIEVIENLLEHGYRIRALPGVEDILNGTVTLSALNEIKIEDLLGRSEAIPKNFTQNHQIVNKNILVVGGAGTIGSELCRQILMHEPSKLVIFDQNEFSLYSINDEFGNSELSPSCELIPVLGSMTDKQLLQRVMVKYCIHTVFHAAAYKHVPLVEVNITSSVFNNVYGTLCICEAAVECRVDAVILISSDKAVRPTNVMGASKRVCELIMQAHAEQSRPPIFSMVRFGNVLNSSGSVIPKFKKQLAAGGPLTVTHKDMTRFFMSIEESASLVLSAANIADGGEVFVLDMGKEVLILDLAKKLIKLAGYTFNSPQEVNNIDIEFTGLRPGEKLKEELLIEGKLQPTSIEKIFFGLEDFLTLEKLRPVLFDMLEQCRKGEDAAVVDILAKLVAGFKLAEKETLIRSTNV